GYVDRSRRRVVPRGPPLDLADKPEMAAEIDSDLVRARRRDPGFRLQHGVHGHHARPLDRRTPRIPQDRTFFPRALLGRLIGVTIDFARRVDVTLRLNGRDLTTVVSPRTTLLDWLRDDIGLTGAKKGCNEGACGTCTVLVDGRRMNGCLTLVVQCAGRSVTTVEGLAGMRGTGEVGGGQLHPVQ